MQPTCTVLCGLFVYNTVRSWKQVGLLNALEQAMPSMHWERGNYCTVTRRQWSLETAFCLGDSYSIVHGGYRENINEALFARYLVRHLQRSYLSSLLLKTKAWLITDGWSATNERSRKPSRQEATIALWSRARTSGIQYQISGIVIYDYITT